MTYPLSPSTYDYLKPSREQMAKMEGLRAAAKAYSDILEEQLPDSADKTYLLRKLREVAMWVNITVTRHQDGSPRGSDPGE